MKKLSFLLSVLLALHAASPVFAQGLQAPSRTVFKCEKDGKVSYSDAPCLGAKRINVEPTRGLNKSSGVERVGADVRREQTNEQVAEALRPIFGENAEERSIRHRRAALNPQDRTECTRLGGDIKAAEQTERRAAKSDLAGIQKNLLNLRNRYHTIKC
jgi:hypothetical protein